MNEPKAPSVDEWEAALEALPPSGRRPWTAAEDAAIIRAYGVKDRQAFVNFMLKRFGRTAGAVDVRAFRLRQRGEPVATYIARRT